MARIKYYYDTETCKYERAKVTKGDVFTNFMGFLSVALIMAITMVLIYNTYFESSIEAQLRKENSELSDHYAVLETEMTEVQEVINALEERDNNIYRKIYEAEPIPLSAAVEKQGNAEKYRIIMEKGLGDKQLVSSTSGQIDQLKDKASAKNNSFEQIMQLARENNSMLSSLPAIQPIDNKDLTQLVSGFGMRINPFHKARVKHEGIDFAAPRNTPVYATGNGKVVTVKKNSILETGYGNYVEIDHGFGYISKYAHLGEIKVSVGDDVQRGEQIAFGR